MRSPHHPLPGQSGHHGAQFYTDAQKLCVSVADFLGDGIAAGQPIVVIATPEHRDAILDELKSRPFDIDGLVRRGSLTLLDASATLDLFMLDGKPDAERFSRAIGAVIDHACRGRNECVVRAYGEMVEVLWRAGNCDGAVRLEVLWNELATRYSFSLLCGYAMSHFYKETSRIQDVCDQHTHSEFLRPGQA
jgi:hypothetical protein